MFNIVEIRQVNRDEVKEAAELADLIFRDAEHTSMGVAFPQIFSGDFGQSFGAFVDGKLASFVGVVPQWIHIGDARLQVYSIGSVCTHPDFRGQGLASRLLERAADHMKRSGASLMLVSGSRSLYDRFGCYKFGKVLRYEITPEDATSILQAHPPAKGIQFREFQSFDWFSLHRVLEQKEASYQQGLYETAQMIQRESYAGIFKLAHRVRVVEENSQVTAYAIFAVSTSRSGNSVPFVIDWGGDPKAVIQLISHTAAVDHGRFSMAVPWQETGIQNMLKGVRYKAGKNGGTVKILNYRSLWDQLLPHLLKKDSDAAGKLSFIGESSGDGINFSIDGTRFSLTAKQFIALLFDPDANIPALSDYDQMLHRLFPIAFPFTEGLNYT